MAKNNQKHLALSADKKLLGVAGGIADYYELDHSLVRVIMAIFVVVTGIIPGLIVYLIIYAIIKSS